MTYDELSEEAKDKAIEEMADINVDYDWWTDIVEDIRNQWLEKCGIDFEPEGLCFDLSYRRELYFSKGKIWVDNADRLLAALSPKAALELALDGVGLTFGFYFETHHYGGGSGRTSLGCDDYRDDGEPDSDVWTLGLTEGPENGAGTFGCEGGFCVW